VRRRFSWCFKAVQAQLGHATASITLDTYGHLFPDELDLVDQPPHDAAVLLWVVAAQLPTQTPRLLLTSQQRIVHRVLASAAVAAQVGRIVQPVPFCPAEYAVVE
jgi:hypothetical protein